MSRLRTFLAVVMAASALVVLAGTAGAGASVPAANAKFCKAADNIGNTGTSSNPTQSQAKKAAANFKKAAKYAPAKVKTALNRISKYLGTLASADASDLAEIYTSKDFTENYVKGITTYVSYYTANCLGAS